MEGMEEKLGSILGNPEMMQKIMAMAQSLSPPQPDVSPQPPPTLPNIDMATMQKLSGIMSSTGIDRNQQALLSALVPYLSRDRIQKLENAMRAAKMAGFAANVMQRKGTHNPSGR